MSVSRKIRTAVAGLSGGEPTPPDLPYNMWYKHDGEQFQDAGRTIPSAIGDPVSSWSDETGLGKHLTGSGPVKRADGIYFSSNWMNNGVSENITGRPYTTATAFHITTTAVGWLYQRSVDSNNNHKWRDISGTLQMLGENSGLTSLTGSIVSAFTGGANHTVLFEINGKNANNASYQVLINDVLKYTKSYQGRSALPQGTLTLGGHVGLTMYEHMEITKDLTAAESIELRAYLARHNP